MRLDLAKGDLWVAGIDKRSAAAVEKTYAASGAGAAPVIDSAQSKARAAAAVDWVLGR